LIPHTTSTQYEISELPNIKGKSLAVRICMFCGSLLRQESVLVCKNESTSFLYSRSSYDRIKTWQEKYQEHFIFDATDKKE
jgi:hypothetical protein